MFGNRTGWIISGVIVLCFIGLLYLMAQMGEQSPPSTAYGPNSPALAALSMPTDPESLLAMTDSCDATDKYLDAIKEYTANRKVYDKVGKKTVDQMPALELIVEATNCKSLTMFTRDVKSIVNFQAEHESIEALRQLGKACVTKANLLAAEKNWAASKKYAEAGFALGAKMFRERVAYDELEAAIAVLGDATYVMKRIATDGDGSMKDSARVNALTEFDKQRQALAKSMADIHLITHNIDGATSGKRAGDVIAVAQDSKERMWRVEAMLQLGRMRYNVGENGRAADQHYAMRLLRKYSDPATEKDEIVRHAATIARDLDLGIYNLQTSRTSGSN